MPDLSPLMDAMEAVVAFIDAHCDHLADCCARGLQLIAIHQLLLNMQLDRMVLDQLVEAD